MKERQERLAIWFTDDFGGGKDGMPAGAVPILSALAQLKSSVAFDEVRLFPNGNVHSILVSGHLSAMDALLSWLRDVCAPHDVLPFGRTYEGGYIDAWQKFAPNSDTAQHETRAHNETLAAHHADEREG